MFYYSIYPHRVSRDGVGGLIDGGWVLIIGGGIKKPHLDKRGSIYKNSV